jgi:hypothetical protein
MVQPDAFSPSGCHSLVASVCIDHPCLLHDLQRLSNNTWSKHAKGSAPLAAFKADFPILFECLHAVSGLMISHCHLCELIHEMMRHGLCSNTGMDQVDAQQAHMISTEYDLRDQRQKLLLLPDDEQNARRIKSVEHSKTKGQVDMIGVQLVDAVEEFDQNMMELLAKPGHRVPSVSLVNALVSRHQDKRNLAGQIKPENKKAVGDSWEQLTVDMVQFDTARTDISNNRVMRLLDKQRLAQRIRITEMSTQKFRKKRIVKANKSSPIRNGSLLTASGC